MDSVAVTSHSRAATRGTRRTLIRGAAGIAKVLGTSRCTVYQLVPRGLPVFKVNGPTSPLCGYRDELLAWRDRNRPTVLAR